MIQRSPSRYISKGTQNTGRSQLLTPFRPSSSSIRWSFECCLHILSFIFLRTSKRELGSVVKGISPPASFKLCWKSSLHIQQARLRAQLVPQQHVQCCWELVCSSYLNVLTLG